MMAALSRLVDWRSLLDRQARRSGWVSDRGVHGTCVCAARDVYVAGSYAGLVQGAASRALERRAACAASDHRDAADRDRGEPDGSDVALLLVAVVLVSSLCRLIRTQSDWRGR